MSLDLMSMFTMRIQINQRSPSSPYFVVLELDGPKASSLQSEVLDASVKAQPPVDEPCRVLVLGSAAVDISAQIAPEEDTTSAVRSTARGKISLQAGGVGRNIAECAARLLGPVSVTLLTAMGSEAEPFARTLVSELKSSGIRTDSIIFRETEPTATCSLILDNTGDLVAGVADMGIAEGIAPGEVGSG